MPNDSAQAGPLSGRLRIKPPVFFVSAGLILLVVFYGAIFTEQADWLLARVQAEIIARFGWLYIAAVAGFLLFALFLMFSRYGDIKLGPDDSEPDYSYASWFAMLFAVPRLLDRWAGKRFGKKRRGELSCRTPPRRKRHQPSRRRREEPRDH